MTELSHSAYEDRLRLPPSCSSDYHSAEYDQGVFAVAADKSRKYIVENGSFNSPKDQEIALEVIGKLEQRLQLRYYGLTPDAYHAALTSLQALVPVTNEKGLREINGRAISPALERRIASRIESPEIDTAGPEGAWGRLPEAVKRHTTYYGSEIMLELGTNCTVGCSFCGLADKGPIGAKMSFDSATEIISYFSDKQMLNPNKLRQDCLYYGTDCFDIKWAASESGDKPERDYTDLVKAYNKITQDKYRDVGTSTAVPIGEELRVINFAIQSLSSNKHNRLRLSVARSNAERVTHIKTILQAVAPDKFKDLVTNDVE